MPDGATPKQSIKPPRPPLPVAPQESAFAGDLASDQAQARRMAAEENQPSPLELPQQSYAAHSTEADNVRLGQEQMAATGAQFTGAPVVPTMGASAATSSGGGVSQTRKGTRRGGEGTAEEEETEAAQAMAIQEEQQKAEQSERQAQKQTDDAKQNQQIAHVAAAAKKAAIKKEETAFWIRVFIAVAPWLGWGCLILALVLIVVVIIVYILNTIDGLINVITG
jgi:hypothetical protein